MRRQGGFFNSVREFSYFFQRKQHCDLFAKIMDISLAQGERDRFYHLFDVISDRMYIECCRPVYDGVAFTENMKTEVMDRYGNEHSPRKVCPLCFFQLAVFPNGDVAPCDAIYMPKKLGNVHSSTLKQMFHRDALTQFQRLHLLGLRDSVAGC